MKKTHLFAILSLTVLFILYYGQKNVFGKAAYGSSYDSTSELTGGWLDKDDDGIEDISVAANGRKISGKFRVTYGYDSGSSGSSTGEYKAYKTLNLQHSLRASKSAKVRFSVLTTDEKVIAKKDVTFGAIKNGDYKEKLVALTTKTGQFFGKILRAVINPRIVKDEYGYAQYYADGYSDYTIETPETAADLTATWESDLTTIYKKKKYTTTGNLIISNDGDVNAGAFTVKIYYFYDYEDKYGEIQTKEKILKTLSVKKLSAGSAKTLKFSCTSKTSLEGQTIYATADYNDDIYEMDEENNTAESSL